MAYSRAAILDCSAHAPLGQSTAVGPLLIRQVYRMIFIVAYQVSYHL